METTGNSSIEKSSYNQINMAVRILLAALFIVSALAKIYGMSPAGALATFENKQLNPMGFSDFAAGHFSRILIGCEFAIGFLLLQKHYFKRFILPVSFLMLLVFCVHLTYVIATVGNEGNCGCFGELLPMSPLGAIIKNVIAMVLMAFLYRRVRMSQDKLNFFIPLSTVLGCVLIMYMIAPLQSSCATGNQSTAVVPEENDEAENIIPADTSKQLVSPVKGAIASDTAVVVAPPAEPKKKASGYKQYFADIDKGKKVLCFFAPGCEHCQNTAKELTALRKSDKNFPDVRIIFMDEETELIPEFFNIAGKKYPYLVMEVGQFWKTLGGTRDTPGVFYLWNGNVLKSYDGINENAFKKTEFKKIVEKAWEK